ncbi:MAG TPA: hypothetical protein VET46_04110 [Steroidobacteraceae bacterium]|nr:hypothetical protein [Steroidobacteraceae bacterium]
MTQRLYAYAILFLRDVFYASPNNRRYQWKARSTMVASQAFLICAAAMTLMTISGSYFPLQNPPAAFVLGGGVLGLALYGGNLWAERRLLPRFERQFHQLSKTRRIVGRTAVILYVMLSIAVFLGSAAAGHAKLCSKPLPQGISVKC